MWATYTIETLQLEKVHSGLPMMHLFSFMFCMFRFAAASPTNRTQAKVIITIVIIQLQLWPATGCEAKPAAEFGSRPLVKNNTNGINITDSSELCFNLVE